MKVPRDLNASDLVKALAVLGYGVEKQAGSHIRLTTTISGKHHITVPNHSPIKLGTLSGILKAVAGHHKMTIADLLRRLEV